MLSKPKYGWADITIGDWSDRCSYLTDVPFQLLEAMCRSCKNHEPVAAKFDAEGWEYTIIFDWLETHIIIEKDGFELNTKEIQKRTGLNHASYQRARKGLEDRGWIEIHNDKLIIHYSKIRDSK